MQRRWFRRFRRSAGAAGPIRHQRPGQAKIKKRLELWTLESVGLGGGFQQIPF